MAVVSRAKNITQFQSSKATYEAIFLFLNQSVAYFSFCYLISILFLFQHFLLRDNYKFCKVKGLTMTSTLFLIFKVSF